MTEKGVVLLKGPPTIRSVIPSFLNSPGSKPTFPSRAFRELHSHLRVSLSLQIIVGKLFRQNRLLVFRGIPEMQILTNVRSLSLCPTIRFLFCKRRNATWAV